MSQSTLFLDVAEVLEIRLVAGGIVLFIIYIFLKLLQLFYSCFSTGNKEHEILGILTCQLNV